MSIYAKISKINKQRLDKIESEFFIIKSDMRKIEKEIEDIYSFINSLEIPQEGTMREFCQYTQRKKVLNTQKKRELDSLEKKNLELLNKQQEYKKAKLEYEKIKYLEEQEMNKKIEKLKRDEQKELDEISSQLFKRSRS